MNLVSLDIRMLRSLVVVAETGSITETARRLGRTQPAISPQVQRLEELTGKSLFANGGRRNLLTEDGTLVLSYAKSILKLHTSCWRGSPLPTSRVTWCWGRPTSTQPGCCRPS